MPHGLVNWREWGKDAFDEAERDGKLVLLDISAVWCHWCHVMDETSYSDQEVAGFINRKFVPVRVDTDRMPDVNERYNMGGWPTTAILTPNGEVLVGATYVPPEKLMETLEQLAGFYDENRAAVKEKAAELVQKKKANMEAEAAAPPGNVSDKITTSVLKELDDHYDPVHGGFGDTPKFPAPDSIELLLTSYIDTGNKQYLDMAETTLSGMSDYGMYDHEMGGFYRYSVTKDWTIPHFEKMLDVNAGLLLNLLDAYRLTGSSSYEATARKTIDYLNNWLWSDEGWFYGSQDANEEYYKLSLAEREKLNPPYVDKTLFTNLNARMAYAYLAAWEVLHEARFKDQALRNLDFILSRMKGERGGFYHYHDGRPQRFGLLTDQSAMFRTLLYACQLTADRKWLDEALSVLKFMRKTLWDDKKGGFFDLPHAPEAVAALAYRAKPMPENSETAMALKTLSILTGDNDYAAMASKCLEPFACSHCEYSYLASGYALAVDSLLKEHTELTFVGDMESKAMESLAAAAGEVFVSRRVVRLMDFLGQKDEIQKRGYHDSGKPAVYVCRGAVCTAKIEYPEKLKEELSKKTV